MDVDCQKPNWTDDGRPKCFNCNDYGHYARDCKKAKRPKCAYKKVRALDVTLEDNEDNGDESESNESSGQGFPKGDE